MENKNPHVLPNQKPLTVEESIHIITNACAEFRGTLADHMRIQEALWNVRQKCAPAPADEAGQPASS